MGRKVFRADHMPALRDERKARVNAAFNALAQSHVDQIHALKKQWARSDLDKLQPEADMRGITKEELAAIILAKPDPIADRELERQRIMLQIDAAQTEQELLAINSDR